MLFRAAGPADVEAVVALVQSAYRGEASRDGWTTEAGLLEGQRTDAGAVAALVAAGHVLVATDETPETAGGGGLLGCCELAVTGERAYFGMFAVPPRSQSRGAGSALLAEAERRATAAGAAEMEMTVIGQRTELVAWYVRRGYAPTGEQRPFPYGDERFGRPRRDDLAFAVLTKTLGGAVRPA